MLQFHENNASIEHSSDREFTSRQWTLKEDGDGHKKWFDITNCASYCSSYVLCAEDGNVTARSTYSCSDWWSRRWALIEVDSASMVLPPPRQTRIWMPMRDSRKNDGSLTNIIALYFPGRVLKWDKLCASKFLGNFYEERLEFALPDRPDRVLEYGNAEAAFQSTKFSAISHEFTYPTTAKQAFQISRDNIVSADFTYGGHGSNWNAMLAVLRAKFASCTLAELLKGTGDDYLQEYNSNTGKELIWSDNCDGEGRNLLGIQLMIIWDELNHRQACDLDTWTSYFRRFIDLETGEARNEQFGHELQVTTRLAAKASREVLDWNGVHPVSNGYTDASCEKTFDCLQMCRNRVHLCASESY